MSAAAHAHQGSPALTRWCPTCHARVIPLDSGICGWCDTDVVGYANSVRLRANEAAGDNPAQIALRLRGHGLSYRDISIVGRELLGWTLSDTQVRDWLRRLGVPKDPTRVRHGHELRERLARREQAA